VGKGLDGMVRSVRVPLPSRGRGLLEVSKSGDPGLFIQSLGAPPVPRRVPEIPGLEVATGALLVEGDPAPASLAGCFSDVFALPGGFALMCGDIYGRARAVASLATIFKSLLRAEVSRSSQPETAVVEATRMLGSSVEGPYPVEVLFARFEPESGRLTLCNCGAWPPLLLRQGQTCPLGSETSGASISGNLKHSQFEVTLAPGDVFVAYTNGIPEARQDKDRIFGIDSIRRLLERHPNDSAQALATRILTLVSGYVRLPFADDAVVLVAKALTAGRPSAGEREGYSQRH
jgi:sigma-B regulation protein RsbU (phosphoserine phosphatase)